MKNANKHTVELALEMLATLDAGGKVRLNHFLPVYNRITGKREKGGCPGCWKARVAYMKQVMVILKRDKPEFFPDFEEEEVEPSKEESPAPEKKKRGRPKKSDK